MMTDPPVSKRSEDFYSGSLQIYRKFLKTLQKCAIIKPVKLFLKERKQNMNKRKKALLSALALLAAVSMMSCSGEENAETENSGTETETVQAVSDNLEIVLDGATEYVVVRSDTAANNSAAVRGTVKLRNAVKEAADADIRLTTDWVKRGDPVPEGTKEILVGDTNRPESAQAAEGLGKNEYVIKVIGDRIVIYGTTEEATNLAMEHFLIDALGYDPETETYSKNSLSLPRDYSASGKYVFNIDAREDAVISTTPEKYNKAELVLQDGVYYQRFDPYNVTGCLSSMQVACAYSDGINVNSDSVMVYTTNEGTVSTWNAVEDRYNIDMMIAINRADLAWAEAHPESIQTQASGTKMLHGSGGSYYMVPTEEFIEYTWEKVEWSLKTFRPTTIAFEEPEMWNASGYSQGFKDEWKKYFGEEWQDPNSSPEALLKSMELKTYLFERIISVMSERMAESAPNTTFYIATHSTVNYNDWGITAGLNHYMATGKVHGIIGQTWSDTIRTAYPYNGQSVVDEYLNAYVDFASYIDSVEGTNFYALADPMCDSTTSTEEKNRFAYLQTIVASLMHPEIHRFEICPWTDRAFGKVSTTYKTILQQCFNALNEVGGKEITLEAGTPGIKYLVSDTISWLKNIRWSPETSDGYYGITMPLATYGIPVGVKSMEQVYTAADLEDVNILIVSYDNQLPMDEKVNDAIADWVKKGGTLLLLSGQNDFWSAEDRFWHADGSPIANLFKKMGVEAKISDHSLGSVKLTGTGMIGGAADGESLKGTHKKFAVIYESNYDTLVSTDEGEQIGFETPVGEGHLIAIGIPVNFYTSKGGDDLMRAIVEYATQYEDIEYVETNLMTTRRGNIVAAHALRKNEKIEGTYIDLYDDRMSIVTDPMVIAKDSRLLYDFSDLDLSVPRLGFSGGELVEDENGNRALTETADKMTFSYTAAANSVVGTRILVPKGVYPAGVKAVCNGRELEVIEIWDNETSSLLILIDGFAQQTDVEITWGSEPVADGQNVYYLEEKVECNDKNRDSKYLIENSAGVNSGLRFCDLTGKLVYKFDITKYPDVKFMLSISQNYIIEVSADGSNWEIVADYSQGGTVEHIKDGGNATTLTLYPADYGITENFYFRIRNSNTSMGWGGSISMIQWRYRVTEAEFNAANRK